MRRGSRSLWMRMKTGRYVFFERTKRMGCVGMRLEKIFFQKVEEWVGGRGECGVGCALMMWCKDGWV